MRQNRAVRGIGLRFLRSALCIAVVLLTVAASAESLRLVTFNVRYGVKPPDTPDYRALRRILQRLRPDVVALQELRQNNMAHLRQLMRELEYQHLALSDNGPFSGNLLNGVISRYPISMIDHAHPAPPAREMSRIPLIVEIDLPQLRRDPLIVCVHYKASFREGSEFRRAIEARRTLERLAAHEPDKRPVFIMGDFNDDFNRGQRAVFNRLPMDMPRTYRLGGDVAFPVHYAPFPKNPFVQAGYHMLDVSQRNGSTVTFPRDGRRLDYVFYNSAAEERGRLTGEVYHSRLDQRPGGLSKYGAMPAPETSEQASDHLAILVDYDYKPDRR